MPVSTPTPPRLILLDKPAGLSSHSALGPVKALLGKKVGHCGTLDPFATGLLIAVSGPLTKIAAYFQQLPKRYRAEIYFGRTTDTLDRDGAIIADNIPIDAERAAKPLVKPLANPHAVLSSAALEREIEAMRGAGMQIPPQYSAIKVGGARAYARARAGETSELAARPIHIYSFEMVEYRPPLATVEIVVSAGTYIRAVARDLAARCGTVAHLSALRRTRIGDIDVRHAHAPASLRIEHTISAERVGALNPQCKIITVPERYRRQIAHGEPPQRIDCFHPSRFTLAENECALLFGANDDSDHGDANDHGGAESGGQQLLAICGRRAGQLKYLCVRANGAPDEALNPPSA